MDNPNVDKDRPAFLVQFNHLFQNKMYADALVLAEERLKRFPTDADAYAAVGRTLIVMGHHDQVRMLLGDLEKNIATLSMVHALLEKLYTGKSSENDTPPSNQVILNTLSEWLANIQGIRSHEANIK
jgi:protein involved in temperature-dependent protein secretion